MTPDDLEKGMILAPAATLARFGRPGLLATLAQMQFPLPPGLPDVVTVWRGTAGVPFWVALQGLSWTLDRGVACKYALIRSREFSGPPLVVRAEIPASSIVFYSNAWREREVIFDGPARKAAPDDAHDTWEASACAWMTQSARELLQAISDGSLTPVQRFCLHARLGEMGFGEEVRAALA